MVNMPGQDVDERLLGFGGNDGQEDVDEGSSDQGDTTGNQQSWARQLGVKKQAKQLAKIGSKISASATEGGIAEGASAALYSSMWRAVLYYVGIPFLIIGGIILLFIFIGIIGDSPESSGRSVPSIIKPSSRQ